uniref:Putative secreted protein n=1 Tax=Ixodes ricinus TaxID=34613 RepID=A0A6B0V3G9_IXORI
MGGPLLVPWGLLPPWPPAAAAACSTARWSLPGMGRDRSWNVSRVVDTVSQVRHCTELRIRPSKTSETTLRSRWEVPRRPLRGRGATAAGPCLAPLLWSWGSWGQSPPAFSSTGANRPRPSFARRSCEGARSLRSEAPSSPHELFSLLRPESHVSKSSSSSSPSSSEGLESDVATGGDRGRPAPGVGPEGSFSSSCSWSRKQRRNSCASCWL